MSTICPHCGHVIDEEVEREQRIAQSDQWDEQEFLRTHPDPSVPVESPVTPLSMPEMTYWKTMPRLKAVGEVHSWTPITAFSEKRGRS